MPSDKKKKKKRKKSTYYPDMSFALCILLAVSVSINGAGVILNFAAAVLSAVIFDYFGCKIIKRKFRIKNCHTVFIGGLIALMLPAEAPVWLPVAGCAFSVFLVKTPFGSLSSAPFSSVAAGIAFLSICRPDLVFSYSASAVEGVSVSSILSQSNPLVTAVDLINALIGSVPGSAGMTNAVALSGLLLFLLLRHPRSFINSLFFLLTCLAGAVVITAINTDKFFAENTFRVICLRMCDGFTLCLAVFFVTDESLSPRKNLHRIFYGVTMGVVYVILNQVSSFEEAGCFAVLLTNSFWPVAEKFFFSARKKPGEVNTVEPTESLT